MQFIRDLRVDKSYEPNQRHCMYGQDADLIMLGLATHEPHFALLREIVQFNSFNGSKQTVLRQSKSAKFQLLHLSILREYLSLDFLCESTWSPDQERIIDDFIFLTFLVGNDFLPHLPTLDISEHAFDLLIKSYRFLMNQEQGYIVCNGEIGDLNRLEKLFIIIGEQEERILKDREEDVKEFNKKKNKRNNRSRMMMIEDDNNDEDDLEEELEYAFNRALSLAQGISTTSDDDNDVVIGHSVSNKFEDDYVDHVGGDDKDGWVSVKAMSASNINESRSNKNKNNKKNNNNEDTPLVTTKDYRGRYYYEKFKIITKSNEGQVFLTELRQHYLQGLIWCLGYYIKGCISWTWYYPYHYGPMLQDMIKLSIVVESIQFDLGQPFLPFQQLLGCLPPSSCKLLPRPYQWLMTSSESPVLHFYPLKFNIDQDGKKNPWEAVVLLDFIDEKQLLKAEESFCPISKLNKVEIERNKFGTVVTIKYDPGNIETYYSPNVSFGLPDIHYCNSTCVESFPSLAPGVYFKSELIDGTHRSIAGFPSLTLMKIRGMHTEQAKINMFGTESKYHSILLDILFNSEEIMKLKQMNLEILLGRIVYVNYPQVHEAKVIAVTSEYEEVRLIQHTTQVKGNNNNNNNNNEKNDEINQVTRLIYDNKTSMKWKDEAIEEELKYKKGRGIPGTGGLIIGPIIIRLRVAVLQGLERNLVTGATKKKYSLTTEADIPIQLVLWNPPVIDTRFEETVAMPVEVLMPYGAEVVAITGDLIGCKGKIIGPHKKKSSTTTTTTFTASSSSTTEDSSNNNVTSSRPSLKDDVKQQKGSKSIKEQQRRVVDVEFVVTPPEAPFGYHIATTCKEEMYSSKDICSLLKISPNVLGKIVGVIKIEPGRIDIGLNLKRNGQYQLLGYCQRVDDTSDGQLKPRQVWCGVDSVEIVGMVSDENASAAVEKTAEADGVYWQYTARAAALIFDYQQSFPMLFNQLQKLPHSFSYSADQLLGNNGEKKVEAVIEWLKAQPFYKLSRTPFTTTSLSR